MIITIMITVGYESLARQVAFPGAPPKPGAPERGRSRRAASAGLGLRESGPLFIRGICWAG